MKNFKLLFSFMKGSRLLYLGAILSVAVAAFLSIINPLVLRFSIDNIIGGEPFEGPRVIVSILDFSGGKEALASNLWVMGLILIGLTALQGSFLFLQGRWLALASESIVKRIRDALYDHLQYIPYGYYSQRDTGDLIQRCTSDLDTIRHFLAGQFVEVGRIIFMIIFVSSIMLSLDLRMTLVSIMVIPFLFIFTFIFFLKVKNTFEKVDESEASMSTVLQENLTGVRVVRAFARQSYEIDKFDKKNREYRDLTYKLVRTLAWYWSLSDLLALTQIGIVVVFGVYWTVIGQITLGTLVVFTTYIGMLLWPIRQLGRILTDMGKTIVALERIDVILSEGVEVKSGNEITPQIKGKIQVKDLAFAYENEEPILDGLSFEVEAGETVAILGPTGSGKSTLVKLLTRLYDYNKGSIKVDGVELKRIRRDWVRKNIGLILQEPFLFAKSIKENISLAKVEAEDEEIFKVAKDAAVHNVILDFDKGYSTEVGERGVSLSGGQKQRVAIARTLIRDCPILIFDDSLSAVDTETDAQIRKALKRRNKDTTTFIISHRITTLAQADKILVLEDGKVVQSGDHEKLISQEGMYREIYLMQSGVKDKLKDKGWGGLNGCLS
ncbi:ABC transporter ATP-binding protein [Halonatronum saccharophilum]|uniref:ABC transporter ATP-binding protein n=1 Tax=Halonatronum saccharophilum TaxID=150060 RepID=UPI0004BB8030|nr:ABC transporter ATP-binding protein [Halonatronum saccharophilum]